MLPYCWGVGERRSATETNKRRMFKMVGDISRSYFEGNNAVTCWTCHRGSPKVSNGRAEIAVALSSLPPARRDLLTGLIDNLGSDKKKPARDVLQNVQILARGTVRFLHAAGHHHGRIDPSITTSSRGLWAVKWSFVGLFVTALLQVIIVVLSGSVALFADTIHIFGDAATAIPLAIAFLFARKKPTKRFSFGYGRVEDLAGVMVVVTILVSACVAAYEAIHRLPSADHRTSRRSCRGLDYWIFGKRVCSPFSH